GQSRADGRRRRRALECLDAVGADHGRREAETPDRRQRARRPRDRTGLGPQPDRAWRVRLPGRLPAGKRGHRGRVPRGRYDHALKGWGLTPPGSDPCFSIRRQSTGVNRLAQETSPYLLQHADNPVDWYPWGEAALTRAREEDRPILLSVGYAACHWCHVMEHESFEDDTTASLMNEHFVCVKVDREERPDLDSVYMDAVVSLTGHGGWPMTVFLTPDGEPFFGGTYFPPEPRHGLPGFRQLLTAIADAWSERRDDVGRQAATLVSELQRGSAVEPSREPLAPS